MINLRIIKILGGLLLMMQWSGVSARAGLAFFLTPAAQPGVGSNEVFFTAAMTNNDPSNSLFLNNLQVCFTNAATNYLGADTNAFFGNVPGILCPAQNYTDVVFGITIDPSTPPGQYCGTVIVQGGTNICALTNLCCQAFQIDLSPAALGISLNGANLMLCWPSPPGGFVLQQNPDLTTTNWTTLTNAPAFTNGTNQVDLLPDIDAGFFRLLYP